MAKPMSHDLAALERAVAKALLSVTDPRVQARAKEHAVRMLDVLGLHEGAVDAYARVETENGTREVLWVDEGCD